MLLGVAVKFGVIGYYPPPYQNGGRIPVRLATELSTLPSSFFL